MILGSASVNKKVYYIYYYSIKNYIKHVNYNKVIYF